MILVFVPAGVAPEVITGIAPRIAPGDGPGDKPGDAPEDAPMDAPEVVTGTPLLQMVLVPVPACALDLALVVLKSTLIISG